MTKMGSSVSAPRMGNVVLRRLTHKVGQGEWGLHSSVLSGTRTPACAGSPQNRNMAEASSRVGCTKQKPGTKLPELG